MNQLNPGQSFPIYYEITDPTESGTNYVRAFIRNTVTDDLIDTVNLTDLGSNRFQNTWQVADDPSGQGLHISITIKVYTDSGYTTLNNNYLFKVTDYVIAQRWGLQFGHGGGADVDYNKIQRMIDEAVSKIKFPESPKLDFNTKNLEDKIGALTELANGISLAIESLPSPEKVDLSSVLTAMKDLDYSEKLKVIIKDLTDTKNGLSDFTDSVKDLVKIQDELKLLPEQNKKELATLFKQVNDFLSKTEKNLKTTLGDVKFTIVPDLKLKDIAKEKNEEKPTRDVSAILPFNSRRR